MHVSNNSPFQTKLEEHEEEEVMPHFRLLLPILLPFSCPLPFHNHQSWEASQLAVARAAAPSGPMQK